jgi:hypothetical protein
VTPLSARALNRTYLARQLLLGRSTMAPVDAVRHLVGLQAQVPRSPYVALWSRLDAFDPAALGATLEDRLTVRIALLRSTIHLVTADDALAIRPVVAPVLARELRIPMWAKGLDGVDVAPALAAGRALIEEAPRTAAEIRAHFETGWPPAQAASLAHALRCLEPLVQVPPRGVWGRTGRPTLTTAEHWLGRPIATDTAPDEIVLRYLRAFGPATPADATTWSGLQGMREVFDRLRPRLQVHRDERGRELFDVPDAPFPPEDTPAPVRFLPDYDNALLSHADRSRIVPALEWPGLGTNVATPVWLVDGFVAGSWRFETIARSATLTLRPMVPLSSDDAAAVDAEAGRLVAFLGQRAADCLVRWQMAA